MCSITIKIIPLKCLVIASFATGKLQRTSGGKSSSRACRTAVGVTVVALSSNWESVTEDMLTSLEFCSARRKAKWEVSNRTRIDEPTETFITVLALRNVCPLLLRCRSDDPFEYVIFDVCLIRSLFYTSGKLYIVATH